MQARTIAGDKETIYLNSLKAMQFDGATNESSWGHEYVINTIVALE